MHPDRDKSHLHIRKSKSGSFDSTELDIMCTTGESGSFETQPSAGKTSIKLTIKGSPERRRSKGLRGKRLLASSLTRSLPPALSPTTSFDVLDQDDTLNEQNAAETPPAPVPVYRSPLPLRKTRTSNAAMSRLTKSLTISHSAAITNEFFAASVAGSSGTSSIDELNKADVRDNSETKEALADTSLLPFIRPPKPQRKTRRLSKSLTLSNSVSITNEFFGGSQEDQDSTTNTTWFPYELKHSSSDAQKKSVHFSTAQDQVHLIHFDWSCSHDYFYSREELKTMGTARFEDAALLRNKMSTPSSVDDIDLDVSLREKVICIESLLATAFNHPDENELASIRGIEHFVYPDLQQEMIRKKKEQQAHVLSFARSKKADPQGWRIAKHSRMCSQWARDVALEKGRAYQIKADGDVKSFACGKRLSGHRRRERRASIAGSMPCMDMTAAIVQREFEQEQRNIEAAKEEELVDIPLADLHLRMQVNGDDENLRIGRDFFDDRKYCSDIYKEYGYGEA